MSQAETGLELATKVLYVTPRLHKIIRIAAAERDLRLNDMTEDLILAGLAALKAEDDARDSTA